MEQETDRNSNKIQGESSHSEWREEVGFVYPEKKDSLAL